VLVDVNYSGTVEFLDGLRPALAAGTSPSAVAIASNSTTIYPGLPGDLIEACLAADLPLARQLADNAGPVAAYPATKTAVCRWIRGQAPSDRWIGAGIRLNAVAPGMIETPLLAEQRTDERIAPLLAALPVPLGRAGSPDEVAAVVAFLLSPASSLMCGSILLADGGTEALLRPDAYPSPWNP
jgi:NAD(P)-dependent dehydrogenase (short-subunit alcohol dehydrogenase family)